MPLALLLHALSCAAANAVTLEFQVIKITLAGDVTQRSDDGLRGSAVAMQREQSQSISWSPNTTPLSYDILDPLAHKTLALLRTKLGDTPGEFAVRPHADVRVDGEPAIQVEVHGGGAVVLASMWDCPKAGVQFVLVTGGGEPAVHAHRHALASARCATTTPALARLGFKFTGDAANWELTDAGDPLVRRYVSLDGVVRVRVWARATKVAGLLRGDTCRMATELSANEYLSRSIAVPRSRTFIERPDGCTLITAGEWNVREPLTLQTDARECSNGYSVYAHALSSGAGVDLDYTRGIWGCD